jgi:uncharacterized protein Usg
MSNMVRRRVGGFADQPKPFAWSYSKLKNFETCPKRYYHIDFLPKNHPDKVVEEVSDELLFGNRLHETLAQYIEKGTILPPLHQPYAPFVDEIFKYEHPTHGTLDVRKIPSTKVLVEQKYAINKDFAPTTWFGDDAWYRGIADVLWMLGPRAYAFDWKTGKVKEDIPQLALMAACVLSHFPDVQSVTASYVWLKTGDITGTVYTRQSLVSFWEKLWPRIEALREGVEKQNFGPKPSGICKRYCPVKQCPHYGTSSY